METIPSDLKRKIALELSPKELINLCLTKDVFYSEICGDKQFWRLKLFHDYPEIEPYFEKVVLVNPKNTYIRIFSKTAKAIEDVIPKEITSSQKKALFNILYDLYNQIRRNKPNSRTQLYQEITSFFKNITISNTNISDVKDYIESIFFNSPLNIYEPNFSTFLTRYK